MKQHTKRHIEWDALEGRLCQSTAVVGFIPELPVMRTDRIGISGHTRDLAIVASNKANNVVFLGDSITDWFQRRAGATVWNREIGPLGAADFGIKEDTTAGLLWRIENGELAGQPRLAVLLIGTNDLGVGESPAQTVNGIETDIAAIHQISPATGILLEGLLPRGRPNDPLRAEVQEVNALLAAIAPGVGAIFVNPGTQLIAPNGSIAANFHPDLLHPNTRGYDVLANTLVPDIDAMLAEPK